jgi:hypothetical protein
LRRPRRQPLDEVVACDDIAVALHVPLREIGPHNHDWRNPLTDPGDRPHPVARLRRQQSHTLSTSMHVPELRLLDALHAHNSAVNSHPAGKPLGLEQDRTSRSDHDVIDIPAPSIHIVHDYPPQ